MWGLELSIYYTISHQFFHHLFLRGITVTLANKVSILARSSLLAARDPQLRVIDPLQAGALAVEFSFGRGKVLHLVGHFDNCANSFKPNLLPDPAPDIGISLRQAITANFLAEALGSKSEAAEPSK